MLKNKAVRKYKIILSAIIVNLLLFIDVNINKVKLQIWQIYIFIVLFY